MRVRSLTLSGRRRLSTGCSRDEKHLAEARRKLQVVALCAAALFAPLSSGIAQIEPDGTGLEPRPAGGEQVAIFGIVYECPSGSRAENCITSTMALVGELILALHLRLIEWSIGSDRRWSWSWSRFDSIRFDPNRAEPRLSEAAGGSSGGQSDLSGAAPAALH